MALILLELRAKLGVPLPTLHSPEKLLCSFEKILRPLQLSLLQRYGLVEAVRTEELIFLSFVESCSQESCCLFGVALGGHYVPESLFLTCLGGGNSALSFLSEVAETVIIIPIQTPAWRRGEHATGRDSEFFGRKIGLAGHGLIHLVESDQRHIC